MSEPGQGDEHRARRPLFGDDYYVYPAECGSLTSGGSRTISVIIENSSDFEWSSTTCSGNLNGAIQTAQQGLILPIKVQVTDTSAGRPLFFAPVPIQTVAGTGAQPYILSNTKIFVALTTVQVAFTNFDTGTWDNIWFVMHGRRVFKYGGR